MKSTGILFLLIWCLLAVSCTSKDKREASNLARRATEMSAALTTAGKPFADEINKWLAGEKADIPAMKKALEAIEPLPGKFHEEFQLMPYSKEQYAVTAYRTSVLDYLESQQKLAAMLKAVAEKASLSNPADEPTRKQVSEQFRGFEGAQQKTLNDIRIKAERLQSYLQE
ncbi:hypothetical protein [Roseimicrobium sp. ORNL1]|uniref:hypothetical protein n=1 Tax=Roseimicrobium sp. ORNL1 TaxID=2711231 RepID=UPI0013E1F91C|nr:hypothetical protein [Roseimicrobium sp. ORNL1]QIF05099.1 hypothetical protein G5S37_27490 [Roseimicrobium sp. ORNL1]